jgi:hypothetical protein
MPHGSPWGHSAPLSHHLPHKGLQTWKETCDNIAFSALRSTAARHGFVRSSLVDLLQQMVARILFDLVLGETDGSRDTIRKKWLQTVPKEATLGDAEKTGNIIADSEALQQENSGEYVTWSGSFGPTRHQCTAPGPTVGPALSRRRHCPEPPHWLEA